MAANSRPKARATSRCGASSKDGAIIIKALAGGGGVDGALEGGEGEEVAGRVDHQPTPAEAREVGEWKIVVEDVTRGRVERGELIARRLQETAERLCGGSLTPLLTQLVDSRRLNADEVRQLRELVDRLESEMAGES